MGLIVKVNAGERVEINGKSYVVRKKTEILVNERSDVTVFRPDGRIRSQWTKERP